MKRNIAFLLVLFGLLLPRLAQAQCVGAGGVPFNCVPGGAIGSSDLLLGGQSSNTVKFTAAQISSFVLGGTQPGVFSSITVPSGGGGELDGVFTGNPTWSGTSTFNGPLDLTPTGGNTLRSQQDIDADVTNVLSFTGVDPTGSTDSCAGINAALAVGKATYLPHGTYYVKCALNAGPGTTLYGDGRGVTTITVDQAFSSSAPGVIVMTGAEQLSPIIRDLSISFQQPTTTSVTRAGFLTLAGGCTSGSGGTGCKYPPAIISTGANRFRIERVEIDAAWDGIDAGIYGGAFYNELFVGALDFGLRITQSRDFIHINQFHFWNFGMPFGNPIGSVFADGNTLAGVFGDVNGANITDWSDFVGRTQISQPTNSTWMHFANMMMDGGATLELSGCGWVQVSNMYFTGIGGPANPNSAITMNAGGCYLQMDNLYIGSTRSVVNLAAGILKIGGASQIGVNVSTNQPVITQTGGQFFMNGGKLAVSDASTPWTVPIIQSTGGTIHLTGVSFSPTNSGSQAGLTLVDNVNNFVVGNQFSGWPFTAPSSPLGFYTLNDDTNIQSPAHFTGNVFAAGNVSAIGIQINGAAGTDRNLLYQTSGSNRWGFGALNNAESGGNTGSDLELTAIADDGSTVIANPLLFTRSTGAVTVNTPLHLSSSINAGGATIALGGGLVPSGSAPNNNNLLIGTTVATGIQIGNSGSTTTVTGALILPTIATAANCTGQPSKSVISITGTGALVQCP